MKNKKTLTPYLLLSPLIPVFLVFFAGLAQGVLGGFGYIPAFGLHKLSLDYFREIFSGAQLWESIRLSLYIAVVSALIITALAVLLSFCLTSLKKTGCAAYALIKIPMFIPWMVTGLIMLELLSQGGFLSRVLSAMGLPGASGALGSLLHNPNHLGVIIAFIWAGTPFALFFILTVMSNIAETLGEAALNLGAGLWQNLRHVLLPLCRPTIRSVFLIMLISCFGCYELPFLLGMTTPRALPVEIYYQYNHFDLRHRPYAMALNTFMLLISLSMVLVVHAAARLRARRRDEK